MQGVKLFSIADHAEQADALRYAVDREVSVEDFVAAMLAVGLRKHHQLHVCGVALELGECSHQVVDLVRSQRQPKLDVGRRQRGLAAGQHVNGLQGGALKFGEEA